jgi:hypothetical protein
MASGNVLLYNPTVYTQESIDLTLDALRTGGVTIECMANVIAPRKKYQDDFSSHVLITLVTPNSELDQLNSVLENAICLADEGLRQKHNVCSSGEFYWTGVYSDNAMAKQVLPSVQQQLAVQYKEKCEQDLERAIEDLKKAGKNIHSIIKSID